MRHSLILVLGIVCGLLGVSRATEAPESLAGQRVDAAEKRVKSAPSAQAYNDLASALCRLARDTEDSAILDRAQSAIDRSVKLSSDDYDAQKLQAAVFLGRRDFTRALKLASELNRKVPDDIAVWGLLVDAQLALGNEPEAERAAQWILDLRPASPLGFAKAAVLRVRFKDPEGAEQFFDEAFRRTSPADLDERAWLLTQNANLQIGEGNCRRAGQLLTEALKLFPDSRLAQTARARLTTAEGAGTCASGPPSRSLAPLAAHDAH